MKHITKLFYRSHVVHLKIPNITHLSVGIMKVHRQLVSRNGLQHLVQQLVRGARSPCANSVTQGDLVTAHVQKTLGDVGHL